ncbi:hypothetical protein DFH09DRAFT_1293563 [Mycena vulgaris]|nr:hypothetical protein DFH09DRAFT_1293563 [Mycena vulgaris]
MPRVKVVSIHRAPSHLSKTQFEEKMEALMNGVIALPIAQRNMLKFEMFMTNSTLDSHIKALGLPAPHPTVVVAVEYESWDHVTEVAGDATVKRLIGAANAEFGFHLESCTFGADVVTKIDKTV